MIAESPAFTISNVWKGQKGASYVIKCQGHVLSQSRQETAGKAHALARRICPPRGGLAST
ncbi:hypothetical protein CFR71_05360 [Novacetimonas pomaceti]|uniref:Uncharacterized protein n=1 Tax=Novacetimonas pomaceti TaxID=2021998 RepID=A0A318QFN1_9PROT|nr:hypothetical protein CFR71_05360 [Novacetimonas pomaceti]